MAVAGETENKRDWKKRESFSSAMLQIALVAIVLVGAVFFVFKRNERKTKVAEGLKEAKNLAVRDNAADLQKALKQIDGVLEVDSSSADALAMAADLHTQLWLVHKIPGEDSKAKDFLARAESADSRSEDRFATKAIHLLADGKVKDADSYIEDLRKQGASSAKLWYAQALAKQREGQLALAREAFKQATDKAWKNARFSSSFAEAELDEGNLQIADDAVKKATGSNPEHIKARLMQSLLALYAKNGVAAKQASDTINELNSADLTPGMKALNLAAAAELAIFEGKYDDALKFANDALAANPDEHFALFAKAKALGWKKDPGAMDAFKAAIAARPTAPLIYIDGAALLQAAGNGQGAMALLDSYEQTFKDVQVAVAGAEGKSEPVLDRDDRYWIARGDVLHAAGKDDEAIAAYDKAIAAKSVLNGRAWYAKGQLFLAKKDYDKAKEALMVVATDDGAGLLPEAYMAMGDLLFATKEYAAGCQHYGFALSRFRALQAPREKMNGILDDVQKRLVAANQKPMAKAWMDEGKALIQ
ncbi:MAG: tetratricopeptide repeat protein [Myxococcaceae bacterium]